MTKEGKAKLVLRGVVKRCIKLEGYVRVSAEDDILIVKVADNALKELKKIHNFNTEKKKALTVEEQRIFMDFLAKKREYNHWKPNFEVMFGTGTRVGEVTGLRWWTWILKRILSV